MRGVWDFSSGKAIACEAMAAAWIKSSAPRRWWNAANDGSDEQLPLWARRGGIGPSLDQCPKLLLRPGRVIPSCPRMTAPAHKTVVGHMCNKFHHVPPPITGAVLDLLANFTERF